MRLRKHALIPCREHLIVRTESATYLDSRNSFASSLRAGPKDECELVEDADTTAPNFISNREDLASPHDKSFLRGMNCELLRCRHFTKAFHPVFMEARNELCLG